MIPVLRHSSVGGLNDTETSLYTSFPVSIFPTVSRVAVVDTDVQMKGQPSHVTQGHLVDENRSHLIITPPILQAWVLKKKKSHECAIVYTVGC